ncbi:hypothetical protein AVEN_6825-1 [Araneus ventricosus]|uniref:Mos1 transposase HTH domain-containing protein n=1 Tax=Araneus ventricosus TaxID=182803 RepID=A0A4Y2K4X6_ARAVE|nr:hypothetical protein AVEN_6825-1 [Araneus ventricosus]
MHDSRYPMDSVSTLEFGVISEDIIPMPCIGKMSSEIVPKTPEILWIRYPLWNSEIVSSSSVENDFEDSYIAILYIVSRTVTETHEMLVKVDAVSKKCVFEWFKRFRDGKEDVKDEPRSGRPPTSTTPDIHRTSATDACG